MAVLGRIGTITPANDTSPATFQSHIDDFMKLLAAQWGYLRVLHHYYRKDGRVTIFAEIEVVDMDHVKRMEESVRALKNRLHPHCISLGKEQPPD